MQIQVVNIIEMHHTRATTDEYFGLITNTESFTRHQLFYHIADVCILFSVRCGLSQRKASL